MNEKPPYSFPAEWEEQDAILLAWPHLDSDWAPILAEAEAVYCEIIRCIVQQQKVILTTPDKERTHQSLSAANVPLERVSLFELPSNDTWARDFGPLSILQNGKPLLLDFTFNGWGNRFPAELDNQITSRLHALGAFGETPLCGEGLIFEGGSIENDGAGSLMTTSNCLLQKNRNPHLGRPQLDRWLRGRFGARQVLWLDSGHLSGDDTDSHIDTLARFAPGHTIIYQGCDDPRDEHYLPLQMMAEELRQFRTLDGHPYRLLALPLPEPIIDASGDRLPAGYANYLVINQAVLVPTYDDPADPAALETIGSAFPDRSIIGIDCRTLIKQHGSLHCATMQIPKGVL